MAELVGVDQICTILQIERRRVQELAKEGVLPKASRGKYDLVGCIHAYLAFLRKGQRTPAGVINLDELRKRKTLADTELAELALEEARGEVVPRDVVLEVLGDSLTRLRSKILALPSRYSGRWSKIHTAAKMKVALREASLELLDELADPDRIAGDAAAEGKLSRRVGRAPRPRRPRVTAAKT